MKSRHSHDRAARALLISGPKSLVRRVQSVSSLCLMCTAVEISVASRAGGCCRADARCRCCCPAACTSVRQERGEETRCRPMGRVCDHLGRHGVLAPPAWLAGRTTASSGPSSSACSSSRPRSSPFASSAVAPTSCRGLRRLAGGWAGSQGQGCCFEIRRGTGSVQVRPAGVPASRGRDVRGTLSAGRGGEGLEAERPGAGPGPRQQSRVSPMGARKGRDDCDGEHR